MPERSGDERCGGVVSGELIAVRDVDAMPEDLRPVRRAVGDHIEVALMAEHQEHQVLPGMAELGIVGHETA